MNNPQDNYVKNYRINDIENYQDNQIHNYQNNQLHGHQDNQMLIYQNNPVDSIENHQGGYPKNYNTNYLNNSGNNYDDNQYNSQDNQYNRKLNHQNNNKATNNIKNLSNLAQLNGYEFKEENGQLIYGPPFNFLNEIPPKDSEVFIGRLPKDIDGCLIVNKFSEIGRIYMFRIMQNFSGLNRGFAFVQYASTEDADEAIRLFNNYEIYPGQTIGVIRSRNNNRLLIGSLDNSWNADQILAFFNNITPGIIDLSLHNDLNTGHNYAYVEYKTHKDAAKSRRILKPISGQVKVGNYHFTVDWACENELETTEKIHNSPNCKKSLNLDGLRDLIEQISRENGGFNNLSPHQNLNNLSSPNQSLNNLNRSPYNTKNDYTLVCTNIRINADLDELKLVFTVNSRVQVSMIKRQENFVLIHYSSVESASLVMKTFKDIQIDFSFYFGRVNNILCQLIWPRSYTELNQILTSRINLDE